MQSLGSWVYLERERRGSRKHLARAVDAALINLGFATTDHSMSLYKFVSSYRSWAYTGKNLFSPTASKIFVPCVIPQPLVRVGARV
jgi:hypothetical protein